MKKAHLSPFKRFIFGFVLTFFLILMGIFLNKTYQMSVEDYLMMGIELLKIDAPKAVEHLKLAQKSPIKEVKMLSSLHLARTYHHGQAGIEQNFQKAVAYYEQAAEYNVPEAEYALALFYDAGDKVPENRAKAIDYMKKAAQTYPEAKYVLGVWMERGYLGEVKMDEVVRLYQEAAQEGVVNAIKSLISIYHGGYGSFPKNVEQEYYWRSELKKKAIR